MLAAYLVAKRVAPRYAVIAVLANGLAASSLLGRLHFETFAVRISSPVFTIPTFSIATMIGVGLPLFIVTIASQNITGIAVMRAHGYNAPISKIITGTGLTTLLLAPFGAFGINFAAITAAIVMAPHAQSNPEKRYYAAMTAGVLYIVIAVFAATVGNFFRALPTEFIMALAGIALIETIASPVTTAVNDEASREPAIITFLVTVSGVSPLGIGSAFWGRAFGIFTLVSLRWNPRKV